MKDIFSTIEGRIRWDYDVPATLEYEFLKSDICKVCKNKMVAEYTAPFIVAKVPYNKVIMLLKDKFGIDIPEDYIRDHESHIQVIHYTDEELKTKRLEDMKLIHSSEELVKHINEDKAVETCLSSLYAKLIYMQQNDRDNGEEYMSVISEIGKLVALKIKMKQNKPDEGPQKGPPDLSGFVKLE